MVDIHSATSEIRRGKERRRRRRKIETTGQKYNVNICYAGGHNKTMTPCPNSKLDLKYDRRYGVSQPVDSCRLTAGWLS